MNLHKKKIPEQFIPRPRSMLESPAYRSLSLSALRLLGRIELEHLRHGGKDNGRLPVTQRDFIAYGVRPNSVAPAKKEVIRKGFLRITRKGRSGKNGIATEFRLTYLHASNRPPTNEWKRHDSISTETLPKRITKRYRIGSEVQQNPSNETVPNKGNETVPLSRESSSSNRPHVGPFQDSDEEAA